MHSITYTKIQCKRIKQVYFIVEGCRVFAEQISISLSFGICNTEGRDVVIANYSRVPPRNDAQVLFAIFLIIIVQKDKSQKK